MDNNGQVGQVDEETALLGTNLKRKITPLPKLQIGIILLLQICEPLTSQSIYPYINQVTAMFVLFSANR